MASMYQRILDPRALTPNDTTQREEVLDAGAYNTLQAQMRVLSAGSAGNLKLQHAAVNEPDAFIDIGGASVSLASTSNSLVTVTNFLRFIRWFSDSATAGSPIALIDVVAKE